MTKKIRRNSHCINCHFCDYFVQCPGQGKICLGCGSCIKGCPTNARRLVDAETSPNRVTLFIDGEAFTVPEKITVEEALRIANKAMPTSDHCGTGSCYNCSLVIDQQLKKACSTPVAQDMDIITGSSTRQEHTPLRLLSFFPNHLHAAVSVFTHGCNYACDFCHNWDITFSSAGIPSTPEEAGFYTLQAIGESPHPRVGISGGEPTLNRPWLIAYIDELKKQNKNIRIQLDTNASLLTEDYIDELFEAGITDISPDMKGLNLSTFKRITGLENDMDAKKYLDASWKAIEYLVDKYTSKLFYHVAIPFHPNFISHDEVVAMGQKLAELDKNMNVNLIVYQPVFRMRHAPEVDNQDIEKAFELLKGTGLKNLWCQEGDDIPEAVEPDELLLMGENF